MGRRGQVTGGAQRFFGRHIGHQPGVVHGQQGVKDHLAHAGVTARQAGRFHDQHQAHDVGCQGLTHAHAVGANQIEEQRLKLLLAAALVGQLAKTGLDAINRGIAIGGALPPGLCGRANAGECRPSGGWPPADGPVASHGS